MSFANQLRYLQATISGLPDLMRHRLEEQFVHFAHCVEKYDSVFQNYLDFEAYIDSLGISKEIKDRIKAHLLKLIEIYELNLELGTAGQNDRTN